ncbi:hypothetical protein K439DRAFT_1636796 [Ramaria rubella]|nr:hypothetical protein K439DRAFT_1636796 [Ramaria rubella]
MSPVILAAAPAPLSDQKIAFLLVTGLSSGMSIISCGFVILTQGASLKLTFDRERQRFLALVSLLAAIFGVVGNGLQQSSHSTSVGESVVSFLFNWLVQMGLAGIAHNSIVRLLTSQVETPSRESISRVSRLCCSFYLLTLPVLTPTFIALVHPSRSDVKVVARDMNIALVCSVELLATAADALLLRRLTQYKADAHITRRRMLRDMWMVYVSIWFTIAVDIFAKVFRNETNDLIPDLAVTNLTLTLRAVAALMYGTSLHNAQEIYSLHSGVLDQSVLKEGNTIFSTPQGGNPHGVRAHQSSTSNLNHHNKNNIVTMGTFDEEGYETPKA